MHLKRKTLPKFWPVARTGTKYLAVPSHDQNSAVSLIVVMRDVLELVKTKKELEKLLHEKKIMINGKIIGEVNYPVSLFDSLSMPSVKKFYRAGLKNRMVFEEITEKESKSRIYQVIGKKILGDKKVQLNFSSGKNLISNEKIDSGDFILMDNIENKIIKIIPLKENIEVIIIKGKHAGKSGKIKEIVQEGENKIAKISGKEDIKVNIKNVFAKS